MTMYRKHRPQKLSAVLGNNTVLRSIQSIIDSDMALVPHSYMITGPTGCGKTTLARILASSLGCAEPNEFNSSQLTGIDFIRNLTDMLSMRPLVSAVTVVILDECHEMSAKAQEGLLKVLEEPPEHAYIIMLTTDPGKLKPTIKNRCTRWVVSTLTEKQMIALLENVLEKEDAELDDDVFDYLIEVSEGVPREMLSQLEKVINLDNKIAAMAVIKGDEEKEKVAIDLCRSLVDKRKTWKEIANTLKNMNLDDPEKIRLSIMGYCASCLLATQETVVPIMEAMQNPFFNTGKNGFILACYKAVKNRK